MDWTVGTLHQFSNWSGIELLLRTCMGSQSAGAFPRKASGDAGSTLGGQGRSASFGSVANFQRAKPAEPVSGPQVNVTLFGTFVGARP
jgi:hypothetical protein